MGRAQPPTSCSTPPPTSGPSCATSCATRSASCCRASSRSPSRPTTRTARSRSIHDLGFVPRIREIDGQAGEGLRDPHRRRHVDHAARRRHLLGVRAVDDGEYLKVSEAVLRIFDRQEDLRANRARARIKFLIDRVGIEEFQRMVDEELEGDWVDRARLRPRRRCCSSTTRRRTRPPRRVELRRARTATAASSTRWVAANVLPQSQEGFSTGRGEGHPRRPDARAVPRPRRRSCATSPAATPARACSRTSSCAGCATRALYDVWLRLQELGLGDAGAHQITDVVSCPGTDSCKLGITSSMGLNAAVQERLEQMQIDDELTQQDPREDERLPERLQPAPHRQHRLLRRGDEGRRPPAARLHPAPRRQLRGRRRRDGQAAQVAHPGQARARRRRALGAPLRGRTATTARCSTTSSSASAPTSSRAS